MKQQEWTVPGAPVKGYAWEAENPRGIVLLTHGFGEYATRYVDRYHGLIPELVRNGFTVYAYDQRGHGASEGRRAVVDVNVLVEDHLKARNALRDQPLPLFLFGHSMGGLVLAASVSRDPRGVSGVMMSSPALLVGENEGRLKKKLAPLLAKLFPAAPVTRQLAGRLTRLKEEVAVYEADKRVYHGKIPALSAVGMLRLSTEMWRRYRHWTLPTLVFHGSQDNVTDPRGSRRFHAAIPASDKTFMEFEGGYHELLNDEPRAEVRELILSWLRERT